MSNTYKRIKLNDATNKKDLVNGYYLNPIEQYVINIEDELETQNSILAAFQMMGPPPCIKNYHAWLYSNRFDADMPNPTNIAVADFYGVRALWRTDYSQGIVMRAEGESDFYIVMECSDKNTGYKHTMIVLTLAGCS